MLRNYVGYNPLFWPRLSHIEATIENWAYDEAACITGRVTPSVDPCPKEFRNCPMDTRLPISLFICKYITVCIIVINCVYWKSDFQNKSASAQFDDEFQSVLSFREPQLSCAMVYSYIYLLSHHLRHSVFAWRGTTRFTGSGRGGKLAPTDGAWLSNQFQFFFSGHEKFRCRSCRWTSLGIYFPAASLKAATLSRDVQPSVDLKSWYSKQYRWCPTSHGSMLNLATWSGSSL